MEEKKESRTAPIKRSTTVERISDRELVSTRTFDAEVRLVYRAWATPELFRRWWVPASFGLTLLSYEADVRVGGRYRLVFSHPAAPDPIEFFGTYLEVVPNAKPSWTNEEAGDIGQVTTVTFEKRGTQTLLVVHDLYPSKQALDEAISNESTGALPQQFEQLDEILASIELE